jgi:hypothetical protein
MLKVISLLLIALGATSAAFDFDDYEKFLDAGSKIGKSQIQTQDNYKKKYVVEIEDKDDDDDDDDFVPQKKSKSSKKSKAVSDHSSSSSSSSKKSKPKKQAKVEDDDDDDEEEDEITFYSLAVSLLSVGEAFSPYYADIAN